MGNNDTISILIPAYENAAGIIRALISILRQDYQNFEVIISDDSVSDSVSDAFFSFLQFYNITEKKYKYTKRETKDDVIGNWNKLFEISTGNVIKILHHDDWFSYDNSLSNMTKLLCDDKLFAFCGTWQVEINSKLESQEYLYRWAEINNNNMHDIFRDGKRYVRHIQHEKLKHIRDDWRQIYFGNYIGGPSATIFKRDILDRYQIRFDKNLMWLSDVDFYMDIMSKNIRWQYEDKPLISIGVSNRQITQDFINSYEKQKREYDYLFEKYGLYELCEENNLFMKKIKKNIDKD